MIELTKFTIVFTVCFVFLAVFSVNGQEDYVDLPIGKITYQKVVAREGWSVPVFADQKTEVSSGRMERIDGVDVQTNDNKLPAEIIILVESCKSETEKSIEYQPYFMRAYTTYSVKGRVFAYRVHAGIVGTTKQQRLIRIPATVTFNYVDEDGSGKFKLRCTDSSKFGTLPEWVNPFDSAPTVKPSKSQ